MGFLWEGDWDFMPSSKIRFRIESGGHVSSSSTCHLHAQIASLQVYWMAVTQWVISPACES